MVKVWQTLQLHAHFLAQSLIFYCMILTSALPSFQFLLMHTYQQLLALLIQSFQLMKVLSATLHFYFHSQQRN